VADMVCQLSRGGQRCLRRAGAAQVLGANFAAGSLGGALAAAVTTPLDVVKTRTQLGDGARHMVRRDLISTLLIVACHAFCGRRVVRFGGAVPPGDMLPDVSLSIK